MTNTFLANALHGLTAGIEKGLEYEGKVAKVAAWAIKSGNHDALQAVGDVLTKQATEILDAKGQLKNGLALALLTGSDPFSGSRKAAQDLLTKYGAAAGVK